MDDLGWMDGCYAMVPAIDRLVEPRIKQKVTMKFRLGLTGAIMGKLATGFDFHFGGLMFVYIITFLLSPWESSFPTLSDKSRLCLLARYRIANLSISH